MQKKLIALAIAGLSTAAFAQSNVTISGEMKMSFENVRAGGATAANSDLTSRNRVTNNTSWIRFAGEENLGNGLTAWFQVEQDVNGDTQAATGWASRNTAVGLKGSFGNVFMGRWDAHYTEQNVAGVDDGGQMSLNHAARSLSIIGQAPTASAAGALNGPGVIGGRLDNVIAYLTPNWNGFYGKVAYSTASESVANALPAKDNAWQLALFYANGPINAFYSHVDVNNSGASPAIAAVANGPGVLGNVAAAATSGADITGDRLGFAYSFPMGLKVGVIWDSTKSETRGVANTDIKRTAWALPISYTTGAHKFYYTYARAGNYSGALAPAANDTGANMNILAYNYSLSKRTDVGVSWARITNKANARYDFWTRNVSGNTTGLAAAQAGADPQTLSFNIRHAF